MKDFYKWFEEAYAANKSAALEQVIKYYEMAPGVSKGNPLNAAINSYNILDNSGKSPYAVLNAWEYTRMVADLSRKYNMSTMQIHPQIMSNAQLLVQAIVLLLAKIHSDKEGTKLPTEQIINTYFYKFPMQKLHEISDLDPQFFLYILLGALANELTGDCAEWVKLEVMNLMCSTVAWALDTQGITVSIRDLELNYSTENKAYETGFNTFAISGCYTSKNVRSLVQVDPEFRALLFQAEMIKISCLFGVSTPCLPTVPISAPNWSVIIRELVSHVTSYPQGADIAQVMLQSLIEARETFDAIDTMYTLLGASLSSINTTKIEAKVEVLCIILFWLICTQGYCVLAKDLINVSYRTYGDWRLYRTRGSDNFFIRECD